MKRIMIGLVATTVCAALVMTACGGNQNNAGTSAAATEEVTEAAVTTETAATEAPATEEVPTEAPADQPVVGGWTINDQIELSVLTDDAKNAFDKAMEGYVGMKLEPVALLATQVVAGTNYLYLCKGEPVVQNPVPGWYLVVVYSDLDGNAQITSCEEIDITDIKTSDSTVPADVVGGWTIQEPANAATLPEDILSAYNTAAEAYKEVTFTPLAILATQVVNGTNYKIFCQGTTVSDEPSDGLYVITLYVDTEGNAEITGVEQVDLLSYLE